VLLAIAAADCRGDVEERIEVSEIDTPRSRPNFLLVVVDDMGFADIEPYGSE